MFKQLKIAEATYHRWRNQYGGMKADDVTRLKELEAENARLKRIVADQVLENQALKEIARGRMKVKFSRAFFSRPRLAGRRRWSARRQLGRARPFALDHASLLSVDSDRLAVTAASARASRFELDRLHERSRERVQQHERLS